MPVSLEPNVEHWVCLDGDKDKSPRPEFLAVVQSARGQNRISAFLRQYRDTEEPMEEELEAEFRRVIVGWRNITRDGTEIPYTESPLEFLQVWEIVQLFYRVIGLGMPTAEEKKRPESPA
jgi:hypothetical protein